MRWLSSLAIAWTGHLSAEVLRLDASLRSSGLPGVVETVPTFRSLMVHYDPLVTSRAELERAITSRLDRETGPHAAATLGGCRPVMRANSPPIWPRWRASPGSHRSEVVALHSGARYHVYMLGFLPGFPYMGDLPAAGAAASRRPAAARPRGIDLDRHQFDRDLPL